ncbi:cytochrome P450 4C1-like [Atheta coriaria]|uniref:cytochrome P450 4C1-like n=1 Tax=Dalotia coriaria TaxID=877792 RepID=UPI0031F3EB5D
MMETLSAQIIALTSCILILSLFIRNKWMKYRKFYELAAKFEKPPGYSCYPIVGHAHHYANLEDIITIATSFKTPYGVVFLGPRIFYFLNDVDLFEDCLTSDKCLNKPYYMDMLKHAEGGLFLARGNTWKSQRKLLNPGFKQRILNFYAGKFAKHDERLLKQLDSKIGQVFDINILSKKLSFQKYFDCAFGLDFDAKSNEYLEALDDSVSLSIARVFSFVGSVDILNKITGNCKAYDKCMKTLTRITHEIVAERLKILHQKPKNNSIPEDNDCEELIFIDYILQCINSEKYDESKLVPELITFIFAGVDTCSSTFSYLCICLSLYPEIQEKVYQEICQVVGDRPFHHSDYQRLHYLHMVIKETMRIFPTGPIIHREVSDDVKIGDYVFPKDSILHVNIINVHRSSKYYKDPLYFDPERFAPDSEDVKTRHRFAYIPFSGGKRNCIGERFGMLSLVSTVVTLMKKFRFETTYKSIEEIRLEQRFTLNAVDGYPVKIYLRN